MNGPSIFRFRAGVFTGTAIFSAYKRASEFNTVFCWFRTIMVHAMSLFAYRNAIISNGKVVFVRQLDAAFSIEVYKRCDIRTAAVFVIGHCIMCRIKKQFRDMEVRKKAFHSEEGMQKAVGIMLRSRVQ